MKKIIEVSGALPLGARSLLLEAAVVEPHVPKGMSKARTRAIEGATARVHHLYPHLFKKDPTAEEYYKWLQ